MQGVRRFRPAAHSIPDLDPAKDGIFERQMIERMREKLRTALVRLELREEEVRDFATATPNSNWSSNAKGES